MDSPMVNHQTDTETEKAPVLEVPKNVAYKKTHPQLLTITLLAKDFP